MRTITAPSLAALKPGQVARLTFRCPFTGEVDTEYTGTVVSAHTDGRGVDLADVHAYDEAYRTALDNGHYDIDEVSVGYAIRPPEVHVFEPCPRGCAGSCCHDYS